MGHTLEVELVKESSLRSLIVRGLTCEGAGALKGTCHSAANGLCPHLAPFSLSMKGGGKVHRRL